MIRFTSGSLFKVISLCKSGRRYSDEKIAEMLFPNVEYTTNYIPDDLSNYKMVKSGQFAMNKMKAWQGSYGVSKYTGIVSPAYFVFDFNYDMNPDYFHYAIRSRVYVSFFGQAS